MLIQNERTALNRIDHWMTEWRTGANTGLGEVVNNEQLKSIDMHYSESQAKAYIELFFSVTGLFFPLAGGVLDKASRLGKAIEKTGMALDLASKGYAAYDKSSKVGPGTGKVLSAEAKKLKKVMISRASASKLGKKFLIDYEAKLKDAAKSAFYKHYYFLDKDPFGKDAVKASKQAIDYIALDFTISEIFKPEFIVYKSKVHSPYGTSFNPYHYKVNQQKVAEATKETVGRVLLLTKIKACREKIDERTRFMESHYHHEWSTKEIDECKGLSEFQKHRMTIPH